MIAPALLLASAVGLLLLRPAAPGRLEALVPRPAPAPPTGRAFPKAAVVVAVGPIVWLAVGGTTGAVLGALLSVLGPRALARLDDTADDSAELAERLPLALDLLGACLAGGGVLLEAVEAVAAADEGPCGQRLRRVAALLRVGTPPHEAFAALGSGRDPAGAAARALSRAAEGGIPVAAAVTRVAEEARRAASASSTRRAKRVGVLAVGPLGACFLPAFIALGVVPTVIGLATPLLRTL